MSLDNYAGLKESISAWIAKGNTYDSRIDDFIDMAEAEFNLKLRLLANQEIATITTDTDQDYVDLPENFASHYILQHTSNPKPIKFTSRQNIADTYAGATTGRPKLFAVYAGNTKAQLGPTPDDDYTLTLTYYAKLEPLSDDNDTNWLLAKLPQLYLYKSLEYAQGFLKNDAEQAKWKAESDIQYGNLDLADAMNKEAAAMNSFNGLN